MPLVTKHSIRMFQDGVEMFAIFHTNDVNDSVTHASIQNIFITNYINTMRSNQTSLLTYDSITSTPLDATDTRNETTTNVNLVGNVGGGQPMPTGNHIWLYMGTAGFNLKAGGKLLNGYNEGDFDLGVVDPVLLDDIETIVDDVTLLLGVLGAPLAIYRPTLSTVGLPFASDVNNVIARGDSNNNRRHKGFQR